MTTQPGFIDRTGEKVDAWMGAAFRRLPARPSILSGAILIFLTLYLPLAIDSCGHSAGTGKALLHGGEDINWPSVLGVFFGSAGRWLYILLLAWAAIAIIFAIVTLLMRQSAASRPAVKILAVMGGAVSFLLLADSTSNLFLEAYFGDFARNHMGNEDWGILIWLILCLAICASFAATKTVRSSYLLLFALLAACLALGLQIAGVISHIRESFTWVARFCDFAGEIIPYATYFGLPFLVWCRCGVWPGSNAVAWPRIRRRLALIYLPAVAGQVWTFHEAARVAAGLIPCIIGIHLIALGFLRLRQQSGESVTQATTS